ncbi:MAG TPA: hypothetical protein VEZ12_21610 [Herpetosiphonaceae bacterium]|nr:hypothetical protein [Herpetosiphonaceae bacterium]
MNNDEVGHLNAIGDNASPQCPPKRGTGIRQIDIQSTEPAISAESAEKSARTILKHSIKLR